MTWIKFKDANVNFQKHDRLKILKYFSHDKLESLKHVNSNIFFKMLSIIPNDHDNIDKNIFDYDYPTKIFILEFIFNSRRDDMDLFFGVNFNSLNNVFDMNELVQIMIIFEYFNMNYEYKYTCNLISKNISGEFAEFNLKRKYIYDVLVNMTNDELDKINFGSYQLFDIYEQIKKERKIYKKNLLEHFGKFNNCEFVLTDDVRSICHHVKYIKVKTSYPVDFSFFPLNSRVIIVNHEPPCNLNNCDVCNKKYDKLPKSVELFESYSQFIDFFKDENIHIEINNKIYVKNENNWRLRLLSLNKHLIHENHF